MKSAMMRVAELDVLESLIGGDKPVADDLDLRLVRDGLEVRVQDAALGVDGLAVAVGGGGRRVEAVGEFELGFGGDVGLGFEDEDLVREEGGADEGEVGVCLDTEGLVWLGL